MKCIHCDSNLTSVFLIEYIPCGHCNKDIELVYATCPSCNIVWKSVSGVVINTSFDDMDFDDVDTSSDVEEMMNEAFKDFMDERYDVTPVSMSDMVHKCLRCEAVSFEIKPRFYHCPDCGFEWEVL